MDFKTDKKGLTMLIPMKEVGSVTMRGLRQVTMREVVMLTLLNNDLNCAQDLLYHLRKLFNEIGITFRRGSFFGLCLLILSCCLLPEKGLSSKARLTSLQGAELAHLVDLQTLFLNPSHLLQLPNSLTFEMGEPGISAEGGILQTLENGSRIAVYFGRQNLLSSVASVSMRSYDGFPLQSNPVEVVWGENNQAFALSFSRMADDLNGLHETTLVGKYGFFESHYEAWAHVHLVSEATLSILGNKKQNRSMPGLLAGGRYRDEESFWQYFGQIHFVDSLFQDSTHNIATWDSQLSLGLEHQEKQNPHFQWYYGLRLDYSKRDSDLNTLDLTSYQLPFFLGAEISLSEYVVLRTSITQNILLSYRQPGLQGSSDVGPNTKISAGLGFRYGSFVCDGVLVASETGHLGTDSLFHQTSLTYNF
jgi:hypothetical protein